MDKIVAIVSRVPKGRQEHDDDAVDRLSHRYSVLVLVTFAVVLSLQQYVGKPITCWVPKEFTGSHKKYANSYCWVKNTYFLPLEEEIPKHHEDDKRREIIYYQWMPFILLSMAFMFYLPHFVWKSFNSKSGVDADNILDAAESFSRAEKIEKKERTLTLITNQMDRFLDTKQGEGEWTVSIGHVISKVCCCFCGKRFGNYLTILYILSKLLYIGNVFAQLFMLNSVLKTRYNIFGVEVIKNAMAEQVWMNSTVFPKVTMCDFLIRRLGNVQRHTVQCLLPINLYTEKMFMFLWFWMVLVLAVSIFSLITWFFKALSGEDRYSYIKKHLSYTDRMNSSLDSDMCRKFVRHYLRHDGVFLLRLIGVNTDSITSTEIITAVYDKWRLHQYIPPTEEPSPATLPLNGKGYAGLSNGAKPNGQSPTAPPLPPYSSLDDVDGPKVSLA